MHIVCSTCEHYLGLLDDEGVYVCAAFPGGIPDVVTAGENDHSQPIEGDHGLTYTPRGSAQQKG